MLRAIMDISAPCDIISGTGLNGPFVPPVFACAGKTDLHLVSSSRRPRRESCFDLTTSSRAPHFERSLLSSAEIEDQADWFAA